MNTILSRVLLSRVLSLILLFALAVAPLRAQTNDPLQPGSDHLAAATNGSTTNPSSVNPDSTDAAPPVRIDATGVHVGGPNGVDIGAPSLNQTMTAIVGIIAGCSIPIAIVALFGVSLYFRHRKNRMLHETLRAMIDKGVPIPPELLGKSEFNNRPKLPRNDIRTGLILIGTGLGLLCFIGRVGFIVLLIGVAFLVAARLEKKDQKNNPPAPAVPSPQPPQMPQPPQP